MQRFRWFVIGLLFLCGCPELPTLDDVILRPSTTLKETPADMGYPYDVVELPITEDRSFVAWHVHSEESKALALIIPGSDANKSRYTIVLPILIPAGYDVILIDYEGFGDSPGTLSLDNTVDVAEVAAEYALSRHEKVVVIGASLGTPLTMKVASEYNFDAVALEATLLLDRLASLWLIDHNLPDLGGIANLWILPQMPDAFDIMKYAPLVEEPKLFMHSIEDDTTPIAGAREVFADCAEPKEFFEMIGGHGEMIEIDPETYGNRLVGFLDRHVAE